MPAAEVILQLQNQAAPELKQTALDAQAVAAAMSREALAAGDLSGALAKMDTALAAANSSQATGTAQTLAKARAEATAAAAVGDYASGISRLRAELAQQTERTTAVIAAEGQLNSLSLREADTAIRLAQAQARASIATKDYASALEILNAAKAQNADGSTLAVANLETQIAQTEAAGTATGALGAELGGLLSPLNLAIAGFGAAVTALKSFGDALQFAGQLQEERTAFGGILGDFRLGNAILDEATRRTRAYGFTQKETTDAFRELAPIIRESTSSTKDQAEALARIAVLHPEDPVRALSSTIEGLKTGRIKEFARDLGLSKPEQDALTRSVASGTDAFIAMNEALDKHGITLAVARDRTDGLAGAERRQAQAEEDLQKAQAAFAAGPGLALLEQRIKITNDATAAFGGSLVGLNKAIGDSLGTFNPLIGALTSYNNAVLGAGDSALRYLGILPQLTAEQLANTRANQLAAEQGFSGAGAFDAYAQAANASGIATQQAAAQVQFFGQAADISAQKSAVDTAAKDAQQAKTALVNAETKKAADSFLALNPTMSASAAFAAAVAQGLGVVTAQVIAFRIEANKAKQDLAGLAAPADPNAQLKAGLAALRSGSVRTASEISDANTKIAQKAADDRQKVEDLKNQDRLIKAKTTAQKIAELERQQAATSDPVKRQELQNQIDQARIGAARTLTSEANKQLNLEERIRDAKESQLRASLDARKLAAEDVLDRLKEQKELATAERILHSNRASADFKAAAAAREQIIASDQQLRALDIAEKQKTAGGTIVNGRVFQSLPSGTTPLSGAGGAQVGGVAVPVGAPLAAQAPSSAGGLPQVDVFVTLDSQPIAAKVITRLRQGQRQSNSAGGGG